MVRQRLWKVSARWRRQTSLTTLELDAWRATSGDPEQAVLVRGALAAVAALPRRQRTMLVMHCLQGMKQHEIADELLCHEFGHYARGHTRLGAITYRGATALADARRVLAETARGDSLVAMYGGVPVLLLDGYGRLYDRVSRAGRRRQEFAADAAAARIAGAGAMAAALRSTHAIAVAWTDFRATHDRVGRHVRPVPGRPRRRRSNGAPPRAAKRARGRLTSRPAPSTRAVGTTTGRAPARRDRTAAAAGRP